MIKRRHVLMDGETGTPAAGGAAPSAAATVAVAPAGGSASQILGKVTGDTGVADAAGLADATAWTSAIPSADVKTWVEAKGFKDAGAVAESAYNLEKLIGFDRAGRTVVVPDDKATPEQVQEFRNKLGVPETPDGYKLPVPEGADAQFSKTAAEWMHEIGIPPKQAEALAKKWNEHGVSIVKAQQEAMERQAATDLSALRAEWGAAYDQRTEFARRAAAQFIPGDTNARGEILTKIETAIGTSAMLKLFSSIGSGIGEHKMVQNAESGVIGALTPAQARQRIESLKTDKAWTSAYLTGDRSKVAEMAQLHQWAYPEAAA